MDNPLPTPSELEQQYVLDTYDQIASEFSQTRYNPWPSVKKFVDSFPPNSLVLDAGCGNGKNMGIRNDLQFVGIDTSENLLKICRERGFNVKASNIKSVPFEDNYFDFIICIAVLHHIVNPEERIQAICELIRITKPGGQIMIQVWAREQTLTRKFVPINDQNDFFVTWTKVNMTGEKCVSKRYYHLFSENEIDELVLRLNGIKLINKFYEADNWCFIIEKI